MSENNTNRRCLTTHRHWLASSAVPATHCGQVARHSTNHVRATRGGEHQACGRRARCACLTPHATGEKSEEEVNEPQESDVPQDMFGELTAECLHDLTLQLFEQINNTFENGIRGTLLLFHCTPSSR